MENSSNDSKDERRETLIAWRLKSSLLPMFKDLTQQAYEAHLIREPKLISLAKFSLSFFAEMCSSRRLPRRGMRSSSLEAKGRQSRT